MGAEPMVDDDDDDDNILSAHIHACAVFKL